MNFNIWHPQVALAGLWLLAPIDLVPEFLPVIGPLDDLLVIASPCGTRPARCLTRFSSTRGRVSLGCWNACSAAQRQPPLVHGNRHWLQDRL